LGVTGTASLDFHTPASATNTVPAFRIRDVSVGTSNTGFVQVNNNNGYCAVIAQGPTNAGLFIASNGTGEIRFNTQSTVETNQMRVTHTASAVNYVQVTGAATGASPTISSQGSDAAVPLRISAKGGSTLVFSNNGTTTSFQISNTTNQVNNLQVTGGAAGASPSMSAQGTDTNIDLTLTPKGTGNVRFGTFTGTALSIAGYIEIKDAGGTIRKLAVVA
jgi:hypothetical protein